MIADSPHPRSARRTDSGSVLVVVLMVMLGLLGLGVTAMWLTSGNLQVGANMNQRTQALYAAEAGVERAREILNALPPPNVPSTMFTAAGAACTSPKDVNDLVTATNVYGIGAIMRDAANVPLCGQKYPAVAPMGNTWRGTGAPALPAPSPPRPNMPDTMGTYTVWLRNDMAEIRQGLYATDNNGSVVITSRGVAADNRTVVMLEVTLGPNLGAPPSPGIIPPPPPQLCLTGRNSCDENNNVNYGAVVGN